MISFICLILIASVEFQSIYAHYGEGIIQPRSSPYRGAIKTNNQYGNGGSKGGGQFSGSEQQYDEGKGNNGGKGSGQLGGSFDFDDEKIEGRGNGKGGMGFGSGIGGMFGAVHSFFHDSIKAGAGLFSQLLGAAFQFGADMMSNSRIFIKDMMGYSHSMFVYYWSQMEVSWNSFIAAASKGREDALRYLESVKDNIENMIREYHAKKHQMTQQQIETLKNSVIQMKEKIEHAITKVRENSKGYLSNAAQNVQAKLEYMYKQLTKFQISLNEKLNEMSQNGQRPNKPSQQGQSQQQQTGQNQQQQTGQTQQQQQSQQQNQQEHQRPAYPPTQQQNQQEQHRPPYPPNQQQSQFEQQQQDQQRPHPQPPILQSQDEENAKE